MDTEGSNLCLVYSVVQGVAILLCSILQAPASQPVRWPFLPLSFPIDRCVLMRGWTFYRLPFWVWGEWSFRRLLMTKQAEGGVRGLLCSGKWGSDCRGRLLLLRGLLRVYGWWVWCSGLLWSLICASDEYRPWGGHWRRYNSGCPRGHRKSRCDYVYVESGRWNTAIGLHFGIDDGVRVISGVSMKLYHCFQACWFQFKNVFCGKGVFIRSDVAGLKHHTFPVL
jgi:hypothetical protein